MKVDITESKIDTEYANSPSTGIRKEKKGDFHIKHHSPAHFHQMRIAQLYNPADTQNFSSKGVLITSISTKNKRIKATVSTRTKPLIDQEKLLRMYLSKLKN